MLKIMSPCLSFVICDIKFIGNVLKEICEPAGAIIRASQFDLGDPTLSLLEIWGAEYQESNALLIQPTDTCTLQKIGKREKCPISLVGHITGSGKVSILMRINYFLCVIFNTNSLLLFNLHS